MPTLNWLRTQQLLVSLVGFALLAAAGCDKPRGTVKGSVKLKDGTVASPGTIVTFFTADGHTFPGMVDAQGNYSVGGVLVGDAKVTVAAPVAGGAKVVGPPNETKVVPIPAKYKDKGSTPLSLTVGRGNQDFPIVLEP